MIFETSEQDWLNQSKNVGGLGGNRLHFDIPIRCPEMEVNSDGRVIEALGREAFVGQRIRYHPEGRVRLWEVDKPLLKKIIFEGKSATCKLCEGSISHGEEIVRESYVSGGMYSHPVQTHYHVGCVRRMLDSPLYGRDTAAGS